MDLLCCLSLNTLVLFYKVHFLFNLFTRVDIRRSQQSTPYRFDCCSVANKFRTNDQSWVLFHVKQPMSRHHYFSLSIYYYTVYNVGTTPYGVCVDDI